MSLGHAGLHRPPRPAQPDSVGCPPAVLKRLQWLSGDVADAAAGWPLSWSSSPGVSRVPQAGAGLTAGAATGYTSSGVPNPGTTDALAPCRRARG
jgi:hypothetical protein